jgi:hypothetical protein
MAPPQPIPQFPHFLPLALEHRPVIQPLLWQYQPTTSELTFTNLFLWQGHYNFSWCLWEHWFIALAQPAEGQPWLLPPVGPPGRGPLCRQLLDWLGTTLGVAAPSIERADRRVAMEVAAEPDIHCEPCREHFDYLYRTRDLIDLPGNKYHSKRNHLNKLRRSTPCRYEPLRAELLPACLSLAERWCEFKRCADDLNLMGEWEAIRLGLQYFQELELTGGVILIRDHVEAFSLGELLNATTAVIHFEKANPEQSELYTLINQQFCQQAWGATAYLNREQDLGEPGLRRAKESYHPVRLEEKFRLTLK